MCINGYMLQIYYLIKRFNYGKTEYQVGEIFQCGLVKLKCVKSENEFNPCEGCVFNSHIGCVGIIGMFGGCSIFNREDETNVIFVKVEEKHESV